MFIAAVVIAFLVNNFVIINANVPSGSMETTIMTKDRMLGNRLAYKTGDIKRGDIVIFKFPDDESQLFVKRVIGLPGDKVVIKEGKIYINDSEEPLEEDYLPEEWTVGNDASNLPDGKNEYNVPEGSYFLMGDNRNISNDARYWNNTYVKKEKIIAKAMCVYFPFNHIHTLESAEYN
ncbi:signal peptidase I [Lachnospiraceae bacterium NSJ-171]|nr:signal peptidase I [Lachnospiraceae bacterium NSJ-171]